jgi:hypothetical protein
MSATLPDSENAGKVTTRFSDVIVILEKGKPSEKMGHKALGPSRIARLPKG